MIGSMAVSDKDALARPVLYVPIPYAFARTRPDPTIYPIAGPSKHCDGGKRNRD